MADFSKRATQNTATPDEMNEGSKAQERDLAIFDKAILPRNRGINPPKMVDDGACDQCDA
jgi:hypothetical protein